MNIFFMEARKNARLGFVLLVIAVAGLVIFEWGSLNSTNVVIKLQSSSTIYLALLSVALFYENKKIELARFFNTPWVGNYGIVALAVVALGFLAVESISLLVGNGIYIPPLFMAALAIGLFYAGRAIPCS